MEKTFADLKKAVERLLEEVPGEGPRSREPSPEPRTSGAAGGMTAEERQEAADHIRQAMKRLKNL